MPFLLRETLKRRMQPCMTLKHCELNTSYLLIYDRYVAILAATLILPELCEGKGETLQSREIKQGECKSI